MERLVLSRDPVRVRICLFDGPQYFYQDRYGNPLSPFGLEREAREAYKDGPLLAVPSTKELFGAVARVRHSCSRVQALLGETGLPFDSAPPEATLSVDYPTDTAEYSAPHFTAVTRSSESLCILPRQLVSFAYQLTSLAEQLQQSFPFRRDLRRPPSLFLPTTLHHDTESRVVPPDATTPGYADVHDSFDDAVSDRSAPTDAASYPYLSASVSSKIKQLRHDARLKRRRKRIHAPSRSSRSNPVGVARSEAHPRGKKKASVRPTSRQAGTVTAILPLSDASPQTPFEPLQISEEAAAQLSEQLVSLAPEVPSGTFHEDPKETDYSACDWELEEELLRDLTGENTTLLSHDPTDPSSVSERHCGSPSSLSD